MQNRYMNTLGGPCDRKVLVCSISYYTDLEINYIIYMVCFKARQPFQASNGKIDFFAEAGTKKIMQFYIKRKYVFFRSRNRLRWFPYVSKILSLKMVPQIGQIFKMLKIGQL